VKVLECINLKSYQNAGIADIWTWGAKVVRKRLSAFFLALAPKTVPSLTAAGIGTVVI
jgi:hypothetical protein